MFITEDDDRSPMDHHNKADDFDGGDNLDSGHLVNHHQNKEKVQQEKPEESAMSTSKSPSVVEIAKVSFNGFVVRIFTDIHISKNNVRCFYFEPVVTLDPSSIVSESNELLKQDLVRFKIKMWDAAIRFKVINRLRSLPSLKDVDIQDEDVHVMPYEEVQLVANPDTVPKSIRLSNKPFLYRRLNDNIDFVLECDTPSVAESLAGNLKKNPELIINKWELALVCRGFAYSSAGSSEMTSSEGVEKHRPTWTFNVSTLSCDNAQSDVIIRDTIMANLSPRLKDLEDRIKAVSSSKSSTCVPVFSVENCINPSASSGQSFGFSTFVMEDRLEHGDFDLSSGIYTVKTAGIYLLNFNALVNLHARSRTHCFDLKVNDKTVAVSYNYSETLGDQPAVISAMVPLNVGDRVGIFANCGKLYQDKFSKTRFFGILLSG